MILRFPYAFKQWFAGKVKTTPILPWQNIRNKDVKWIWLLPEGNYRLPSEKDVMKFLRRTLT